MRSVYDLKTKSEMIMFLLEFRRSLGESINMINHVILYLQQGMGEVQSLKHRMIFWIMKIVMKVY